MTRHAILARRSAQATAARIRQILQDADEHGWSLPEDPITRCQARHDYLTDRLNSLAAELDSR